jgi:hypothetical protein
VTSRAMIGDWWGEFCAGDASFGRQGSGHL